MCEVGELLMIDNAYTKTSVYITSTDLKKEKEKKRSPKPCRDFSRDMNSHVESREN